MIWWLSEKIFRLYEPIIPTNYSKIPLMLKTTHKIHQNYCRRFLVGVESGSPTIIFFLLLSSFGIFQTEQILTFLNDYFYLIFQSNGRHVPHIILEKHFISINFVKDRSSQFREL